MFSLPLGAGSVKFTHWLSREAVWERYHNLSQFAVIEGEEVAVSPIQSSFDLKNLWLTT